MYPLLKIVANPFTVVYLLLVLAVAEIVWKRRLPRGRLAMLMLLSLILGLVSTPVAGYLALGSLEWSYPPVDELDRTPDAIVVLSGGVLWPDAVRRELELGTNTLYRCLKAAQLYQRFGPCKIVLSGGYLPADAPASLAYVMSEFLITQGVAPTDLVLEERSTTTQENAVEVARMLDGLDAQTIVLVTDASHLRRAEGCFAAKGVRVIPVGCRYRATEFRWEVCSFIPNPYAAAAVAEAAHEWMGMGWYWIRGSAKCKVVVDGGTAGRRVGGTVGRSRTLSPVHLVAEP